MTTFNKEQFTFDGMYLNYEGDQGEFNQYYTEPCHPSRLGTVKSMFIARFKYGRKPYKTWINFISKNFTVEEWATLAGKNGMESSPVAIMKTKGFLDGGEKKLCKAHGLAPTVENYSKACRLEWENNQN